MRMMLRWRVPVERGNEAIADGSMTRTIEGLVEALRPESAYFWPEEGERAGMMVFDMADTTEIPRVVEPLFQSLDADVSITPVMDLDDLKTALAGLSARR